MCTAFCAMPFPLWIFNCCSFSRTIMYRQNVLLKSQKLERCIDAGVIDYASVVKAPFLKTVKINIPLTYIVPKNSPLVPHEACHCTVMLGLHRTLYALYIFFVININKNIFLRRRNSRFLIILDNHGKNKKYGNFVSISSLTGKCAAQK